MKVHEFSAKVSQIDRNHMHEGKGAAAAPSHTNPVIVEKGSVIVRLPPAKPRKFSVKLPKMDERQPLLNGGRSGSVDLEPEMATDAGKQPSPKLAISPSPPSNQFHLSIKLPLAKESRNFRASASNQDLSDSMDPEDTRNHNLKAVTLKPQDPTLSKRYELQEEPRICTMPEALQSGNRDGTIMSEPSSSVLSYAESLSATVPEKEDLMSSKVQNISMAGPPPQTFSRLNHTSTRRQIDDLLISSIDKPDDGIRPPQNRLPNRVSFPATNRGYRNILKQAEWAKWPEVRVKVADIPLSTTIRDLWKALSKEGNIVFIELFENNKGIREGRASVRFSPPPAKPFWENVPYAMHFTNQGLIFARIALESRPRTFLHPSPVDLNTKYPELMVMFAESLEFGVMLDSSTMISMYKVLPTIQAGIQFRQNMLHREIVLQFQVHIKDWRSSKDNPKDTQLGKENRTELLRFRMPFSQLHTIHQTEKKQGQIILLFSMDRPPQFFKSLNLLAIREENARIWNERDAWYRQTDIVYSPQALKRFPVTLKKTRPIIDIGRWTTYRVVFDMSKNDNRQFDLMRQALKDYNIETKQSSKFEIKRAQYPTLWAHVDNTGLRLRKASTAVLEPDESSSSSLRWPVRYQLEVCISHGYLNEFNLGQEFVRKLMAMDAVEAQDLLEYVANQGKRIFDPMAIFDLKVVQGSALRAKIPRYCVYTRSATITPSTVYFNTPTVDTSNRVVREYDRFADRFLRVRFGEEDLGKVFSSDKDTENEVFTRIKRALTNGIIIGNRHYQYLASGNSQFREQGAYFFAPLPELSTEKIRAWMGSFADIKVVAKYASRLGQCFSTTRAIHGATAQLVEIADIKRNGYNFTDGVGRISEFLAQLAAYELGISPTQGIPSAFQFRIGGCKGVLAISPDSGPREIHIRETQYKFPASHEGLEIIRWSQYACANLNRQVILILSALGVPDEVFRRKLQLQLSKLEQAMTDEQTALEILQKDIDHNQMTLVLAGMILDGFQKTGEPFVTSLLQLWRAWSIKYLKEKARITIPDGALLLGCVDETGLLRGHYDDNPAPPEGASNKVKARFVPEVFIQVSRSSDGISQVILGPVLLARNPSLHPGDIRVVCGVDVPGLRHLKDVVVLPQTGDRDVAGMCSGGDLDGDDFLVIWDQDLLPREWNHEPMDYTPPPPVIHHGNIGTDDLTTFFVTYMKNDTLSCIAHAHLANADYMEEGVKDEKCLRLAALHSMAVDFVKSGQPARMTQDLRPRKWPHFMEKKKPKELIYISQKVLGQLYDQVERVDFVPAFTAPFDKRILEAFDLSEGLLEVAHKVKSEYDAHMHRIMAQHEIKTEFEVWSTFVLHHTHFGSDYKYHEVIGQLSMTLKEQFRNLCYERAGGKDFEHIGPFAAAMYKVTALEMGEALEESRQTKIVGGHVQPLRKMTPSDMPLMSFPWLFPDILGKIVKSRSQIGISETHCAAIHTAMTTGHTHSTMKPVQPKRTRVAASLLEADDDIKTSEGVFHRGETITLFGNSENLIDFDDYNNQNTEAIAHTPSGSSSGLSSRSVLSGRDSSEAEGAANGSLPIALSHGVSRGFSLAGIGGQGGWTRDMEPASDPLAIHPSAEETKTTSSGESLQSPVDDQHGANATSSSGMHHDIQVEDHDENGQAEETDLSDSEADCEEVVIHSTMKENLFDQLVKLCRD